MVYGADFHPFRHRAMTAIRETGSATSRSRRWNRARDAVRTLKAANQGKTPDGGVTVWLRGGRYELTEPFALEP